MGGGLGKSVDLSLSRVRRSGVLRSQQSEVRIRQIGSRESVLVRTSQESPPTVIREYLSYKSNLARPRKDGALLAMAAKNSSSILGAAAQAIRVVRSMRPVTRLLSDLNY